MMGLSVAERPSNTVDCLRVDAISFLLVISFLHSLPSGSSMKHRDRSLYTESFLSQLPESFVYSRLNQSYLFLMFRERGNTFEFNRRQSRLRVHWKDRTQGTQHKLHHANVTTLLLSNQSHGQNTFLRTAGLRKSKNARFSLRFMI